MSKLGYIFIACCSGLFFVLLLSMKRSITNVKLSADKLNHIDTVFHNDSVFSVLNYSEGKLVKLELKQFINQSSKKRSYGLQTLDFFDNGRLQYLKLSCRDTVLSSGSVAYEEQTLELDTLNRIRSYTLMDQFKIVCKK
jgi:hypothetical protein